MTFRKEPPNVIRDDAGSSLEILGRTGIRVTVDGRAYSIDSEMLAEPMSIALYRNSISPDVGTASTILEFAYAALRWAGFTVEAI
jgi:hypothetical protein